MKYKVKNHSKKVVITLGVVVLTVGLMSFGRGPHNHSRNKNKHNIEKAGKYLSKKLDLTEDQSIQVIPY